VKSGHIIAVVVKIEVVLIGGFTVQKHGQFQVFTAAGVGVVVVG
jgi:hypothetical protein